METNCYLKCLRKILNNENVSFLSNNQLLACHNINLRQKDLLIILPTGAGKSMTYVIPTILNPSKVSVVIIPLSCVITDQIFKLTKYNIKAVKWPDKPFQHNSNLLFASVEHIANSDFRSHMKQLHYRNELGRLIIDEAHMLFTDNNYRDIMNELYSFREVSVPLVFLTATMPDHFVGQLKEAFHLDHLQIIRSNTNRKNIKYCIDINVDENEALKKCKLL